MDKILLCAFFALFSAVAQASWYWPFGNDDKDEKVRLSDLLEPASLLIDEASDLAAEGDVGAAVEKYRAALVELDRIEAENPERVDQPEFSTVKTKRAYVTAAIDSMLLAQARQNARVVGVSDTTELEKRLKAERGEIKEEPNAEERATEELPEVKEAVKARETVKAKSKKSAKSSKRKVKKVAERPLTKREAAIKAIAEGNFAVAERQIKELLDETPNDAAALNLRAAMEAAQGKFKEAEKTLDQAIHSNPRDYHAYYNMALLYLQSGGDRVESARRYYESGRAFGGPVDVDLEALLK